MHKIKLFWNTYIHLSFFRDLELKTIFCKMVEYLFFFVNFSSEMLNSETKIYVLIICRCRGHKMQHFPLRFIQNNIFENRRIFTEDFARRFPHV